MAHDYPEDMEPSLDSDAVYDPDNFSFPHGTHLAAIEVDTETGRVTLRKYVCVDDIGTVVNPLIVEGQVHGGLAQGIAQALFEEANYDEQGTLVNGTFVDYTLPSAADLPSFDTATVSTPATSNPLGVKGVGEAGTIASTPAIVNGVLDALRHLGVTEVEMPTTSQRVWRAIQEAKGRSTQETPVDTHSPGAGLGSIDPNNPQPGGGPVIPSKFDYVKPASVAEAVAGPGRRRGGRQDPGRRAEPAPGAAAAAGRAVGAHRPGRHRGAARHPRGRRPDRDRGDDRRTTTSSATTWSSEHVALLAQATETVADNQVRHRGTLGGALAHADPAGDLGAPALALDAEMVIAGASGTRTVTRGRVLRRLLHHGDRRGRDPHRDPVPAVHRLGQPLREVQPDRAGLVDVRGRGRDPASTAAPSPRPGSG